MANLLVIGGSGFFGKSILDAYRRGLLVPWGIDRIEVVARKASNLAQSNPELVFKNVFLHDLDITSSTYLPAADYVIHAAASTDAKNYLSRPDEERKNIQLGTLNFCTLAEQFLKKSKVLYVSSGAVYGQQPSGIRSVDESFDLQDSSTLNLGKRDYAAAKRDGESCIQELGKKGFDVSIARCFAFVGLYLPRDQHFAIGNFIEDGLQGRSINVKAQYSVYRSYLYADDLILWLMTIINKAGSSCPIVNVGSDEAILMGDLAKKVAKHFGVNANVPIISSEEIDRYVPAISKALDIGCKKPLSLEVAICLTIHNLRKFRIKNS
jgi:dTDP-glucose 4,6-dehydratase